jgi:cell division protein FtsB
MADLQGKSLWRRWAYSPVAVGFLVLLILLLLSPVWKLYRKSREASEGRSQAAAQLAELEARRAFLAEEVKRLETERGVEGEIRKKFPVVRAGERVIIVLPNEEATTTATTSEGWLDRFENWLD